MLPTVCHAGGVNDVSWGALALTLTLIGCLWTWWAWRHRGVLAGVRGIAWTMLPVAAWLTGVLPLLGQVTSAVTHWATRLVFSPVVWLGITLAGTSFMILAVTGVLERRRAPAELPATDSAPAVGSRRTKRRAPTDAAQGSARATSDAPGADDDFSDIEALLRQRGIQ